MSISLPHNFSQDQQPTTSNLLCDDIKKTPYNYTVPPSSSSCVFIFLSLPTSFSPTKNNPTHKKKNTTTTATVLGLPPFFGFPFLAPSGASTSTGTVSSTGNGISSSTGAAAMAGTDALPSSSRGFLAAGLAGFKIFPGENAFGFEKWRFINVLWIY